MVLLYVGAVINTIIPASNQGIVHFGIIYDSLAISVDPLG